MALTEDETAETGHTGESLPVRPLAMVIREESRLALRDALEPGRSIVVVQGMGGTGKTWLALDVANEVRGTILFADVVWATARDTKLTFDNWLRLIARARLEAVVATLPDDQLATQVADLLRRHAVLLVVDNFENIDPSEQDKILRLAHWINPPSRILLTSRHIDFLDRMPAESASPRVLALGGLTLVETRHLFFDEVHRLGAVALLLVSEAQIASVYEVTQGHPLAVRLVVAEALTRPLIEVIEDLRRARGDLLNTLFDRSWERLDEGARLTLQAASLLGGPVSHEALTAMTDLSADEVDRAAQTLQRVSLLEARDQQAEDSQLVGLHPLTRGFVRAREQEVDGLAEQLMDRAVLHYLELVGWNSGFQNARGHERIERELATILAVRDWCHERGKLLWLLQFGPWLGNYFWVRGYWRERIRSGVLAQTAAAGLGLKWQEGEILSRELGWSHLQLEEFDEAWSYLNRAEMLLREVGHLDELASCWRYLGQIALRKEDLTTCQKLLGLALNATSSLADEQNREYAMARTQNDLGYLALKQHDLTGAASQFQDAVDFFRRVGDELRMGYGLNGLGDVVLESTKPEKAEALYFQSLEIADRFGSQPDRARALIRLARLHRRIGKQEQAVEEATEALGIARRLGLPAEAREAGEILKAPCPLCVNVPENQVRVYGIEVRLEPLAVELLGFLEERQGALCSYDDICARLWHAPIATPELRASVRGLASDANKKIKKALKAHVGKSVRAKNVFATGYRLEISG